MTGRGVAPGARKPEVHKRLTDIQFEVLASTPEQFAEYIRWETPRWAKVIRDTGAKAGN